MLEEARDLRRIVSSLIVALLFLGFSVFTFTIQPTKEQSGTIIINPNGSISSPVAANITNSGNVTYTFSGNNYLPIVVNRSNIIINGEGHTLQALGGTGFSLSGVRNVKIKNTTITNSWTGIGLNYSSDNVLSGNSITANTYGGIGVYYSSDNNTLSGNNITANSDGIDIESFSDNNTVSGNNVKANGNDGIDIYGSSGNVLSGNNVTANSIGIFLWSSGNVLSSDKVTSNGYGIYLETSDNNALVGNNVATNGLGGIYLNSYSNNNVLSGNNITANTEGVDLYNSSGNKIFHNDFSNNGQQAHVFNSTNTWDDGYPSGGNYWSNYTGVDQKNGLYQNLTGSDGIGDTPYVIDLNNTDHYPLMGAFYNFSVYLRVPPFNVTVISNSTVTGFHAGILLWPQGRFIWFNVRGRNGSTGFCRVSIPTDLMEGTFTVYINGTEIPYHLLPCSNANVSYLYFNYTYSTEQVSINVPEFPSILILPLFMITSLLAVIIYRKRTSR
jgi:parallel beta-helix repeat protein